MIVFVCFDRKSGFVICRVISVNICVCPDAKPDVDYSPRLKNMLS